MFSASTSRKISVKLSDVPSVYESDCEYTPTTSGSCSAVSSFWTHSTPSVASLINSKSNLRSALSTARWGFPANALFHLNALKRDGAARPVRILSFVPGG